MGIMRVIHPDVRLNFGKYKGLPVTDVLVKDTGYFFWLVANKKAALAPAVKEVVVDWAKAHPQEANRIVKGAGASVEAMFSDDMEIQSLVNSDTLPPVSPKPVSRPSTWGTW